jgi:hypothetical protein
MNGAKPWIVALVLLTFLSGTVSGWLLANRMRPVRPDHLMADYETRLIAAFELDETQRQDLRFVLDRYEKDLYDLEARYLRETMEDDLVELGNRTFDRIRRYVIPAERLAEFDALAAGISVPSPTGYGDAASVQ